MLVVGNVATGKTSVINRFAKNKFSKDYQTTIGVDFALKRVRMGSSELNVQLWDIAGQERFAGLSRVSLIAHLLSSCSFIIDTLDFTALIQSHSFTIFL